MKFFHGQRTRSCSNGGLKKAHILRAAHSRCGWSNPHHQSGKKQKLVYQIYSWFLNVLWDGLITFLHHLQLGLVLNDMRTREMQISSRGDQTSCAVENPTTCARIPSNSVALIQHKTFWSCWTHSWNLGLLSLVGWGNGYEGTQKGSYEVAIYQRQE